MSEKDEPTSTEQEPIKQTRQLTGQSQDKMSSDAPDLAQQMLEDDGNLGQRQLAGKLIRSAIGHDAQITEKLDAMDEVSQYYLMQANYPKLLQDDNLHEIGQALMENYANLKKTATQFNIKVATLRILIESQFIVKSYWEKAVHLIKNLSDSEVLEAVTEGDKEMTKMLHRTLYKGRKQGGYNPNEFGALGYTDEVAEKQTEHVAKDTEDKEQNVTININFVDKSSSGEVESDFIDGEFIEAFCGEGEE